MEVEIPAAKNEIVEIKVSLSHKAIAQIVVISTVANFAAMMCMGFLRVMAAKKIEKQLNNEEN